jgi:hypothetical protein
LPIFILAQRFAHELRHLESQVWKTGPNCRVAQRPVRRAQENSSHDPYIAAITL